MGTLGYVSMIDELDEQLAADAIGDGNTIDRMVVACGSGGGRAGCADRDARLVRRVRLVRGEGRGVSD